MKRTVSIAALASALATAFRSPSAQAQTTVMVPPPASPPTIMVERPVLPNPVLLRGGFAILLVGYGPAAVVGHIKAGKMRALAGWGDKRLPAMPDLQCIPQ